MASARSAYCRACAPSSASRAAIWENRSVGGERLSITGWPQKATLLPFRKASRASSPCAAWRNGHWTITRMDAVWVFPSILPGSISPPAACISWPPSELSFAHLRPTPKSSKRWKLSSASCARLKRTSLLSSCFWRQEERRLVLFKRAQHALESFQRMLRPLEKDQPPFLLLLEALSKRADLFHRLRAVLRLEEKNPTAKKLHQIRAALQGLKASLRRKRPERGRAKDTREAIDLILEHLDRHGPYLWGHALRLPRRVGGGIRLVARTNNGLESLFHTINTENVAAAVAKS